jgi:hypothetical protein
MTLTERIHAASWWSEWDYPIYLSAPDVLDSIGHRAEIACIMRDVVQGRASIDGQCFISSPYYWPALRALDAYRPWCLDSFIRAADAVLEVCP